MFINHFGGSNRQQFAAGKRSVTQRITSQVPSGHDNEQPVALRFGSGKKVARGLAAFAMLVGGVVTLTGCDAPWIRRTDDKDAENNGNPQIVKTQEPTEAKPVKKYASVANFNPGWTQVASGVDLSRFGIQLKRGPLQVNVLRVDPRNPDVQVLLRETEGKLPTRTHLTDLDQAGDIAGVNGSFFRLPSPFSGLPVGLTMHEGRLITGPTFNRTAVGIKTDGSTVIGKPQLDASLRLSDGQVLKIDNINQMMPDLKTHVMVYTPDFGPQAPKPARGTVQIGFSNGWQVQMDRHQGLTIPQEGFVLSVPESNPLFQSLLTPGQSVQLNVGLKSSDWQDVKEAVSGGPQLLKDGQAVSPDPEQDFTQEFFDTPNPRMAVGSMQDGRLLLVAIDGRQQGFSVGATIPETAEIMRKLGAWNALNLDGGGSAQMMLNDHYVNSPSDGQPRSVPDGLYVHLDQPLPEVPGADTPDPG